MPAVGFRRLVLRLPVPDPVRAGPAVLRRDLVRTAASAPETLEALPAGAALGRGVLRGRCDESLERELRRLPHEEECPAGAFQEQFPRQRVRVLLADLAALRADAVVHGSRLRTGIRHAVPDDGAEQPERPCRAQASCGRAPQS